MAQRRYGGKRSPAISSAGQEAKPEQPAPAEQHPLGSEPPSPSAPDTQAPRQEYGKPEPDAQSAGPVSNLGQQLRDMRAHAAQPQPDQLDLYIHQHFPGAWPHERAWLRSNQHHLANPSLINHAAAIALQRGVPRQSPEFLHAIGMLLDQHHAAMAAPAPPAPSMPPPPPLPEPPMPHATQIDIETDEPETPAHHYAAPPSRDYAHAEPEAIPSRTTLSPQERDHARASGVSDEVYAKEKLRMLKAKKSGLIKD